MVERARCLHEDCQFSSFFKGAVRELARFDCRTGFFEYLAGFVNRSIYSWVSFSEDIRKTADSKRFPVAGIRVLIDEGRCAAADRVVVERIMA